MRGCAFICISRRILFELEGDICSPLPKTAGHLYDPDLIPSEEYLENFMRYYRRGNATFIKEGSGVGHYPAREIVTDQADILKLEM